MLFNNWRACDNSGPLIDKNFGLTFNRQTADQHDYQYHNESF